MMKITAAMTHFLSAAIGVAAVVGPAYAEGTAPGQGLSLELNGAQASDKGCRLTFVVANNLGADLSKAAFEIALFNDAGVVDRLTVLDFKDLPAGKTKVTRFDLAGTDCAKLGRVLINSATECVGAGVEPATCLRSLKTTTKTGIAFGL